MNLHLVYKSGRKVVYSIANYSICLEKGFLEMYSFNFSSHAKRIELSKLNMIFCEEIFSNYEVS